MIKGVVKGRHAFYQRDFMLREPLGFNDEVDARMVALGIVAAFVLYYAVKGASVAILAGVFT